MRRSNHAGILQSVFGHIRNKISKGIPNYDDVRVNHDCESTDYGIHKPVL